MINLIVKNKFAFISFVSGFTLMAVEIIASRIIAPIVGSSLYTWTAIIGIVLLGISLGNYFGGKTIDKNPTQKVISYSLISSAISISLIPLLAIIVEPIVFWNISLLLKVSLIAIFLFFLPSFFLGTIFPSIIRLNLNILSSAGQNAGIISGLGALGSIFGTFFTGFFLIGFIGSSISLYILATILVLTSFIFNQNIKNTSLAFLLILTVWIIYSYQTNKKENLIFESESNYYNIKVAKTTYNNTDTKVLFLDLDSHSLEGMDDKKIGIYQEISPILNAFTKDIKNALVIGGGSYQIPKDLVRLFGANVTVIEIDPEVTRTADNFFDAKKYNMQTHNLDGRLFLKTNGKKYDVIFADAFNSFISMPWYMATEENFELSRKSLSKNGIYALSLISSIDEKYNRLYQSLLKTFAEVFDNYTVLALGKENNDIQNIIIIGKNSDEKIDEEKLNFFISEFAKEEKGGMRVKAFLHPNPNADAIVLRDDFAPVERLTSKLVDGYINQYTRWAYSIIK